MGLICPYYSYDANGALTNTDYSDGTPTISLAYNRAGQQIRAEDAAGVTTFAYDDFGALTNETVVGVAGTNTIERYYDSFGRDAGYALNGVRQSMLAYDPATGRLVTMLAAGSDTPFTWNYLAGSDLKSSLVYPNGLTASWQYDANSQLLQVRNAFPTNTISQHDYVYDAAGRRVQISRSGSAMSENRTDVYGYNERGELVSAAKNAEGAEIEYAYEYDDIGNRITSFDLGTNRTYIANNLNQYTQISNLCDSLPAVALAEAGAGEVFHPQFDDDGNQTLIQTATGIWQVQYNGENRPIHWSCVQSNNSNNQTVLSMSYDRMGRRVMKNDLRFVYDGYLQIANFKVASTNSQLTTHNLQLFIWDPTEPVATRPLEWNCGTFVAYYTHDGNKNVSEVVSEDGDVAAHYEYAPFGAIIARRGSSAKVNHWLFSGEFTDDETGAVSYNFRFYDTSIGRWSSRDPIGDEGGPLYGFCGNTPIDGGYDVLGLLDFGSGCDAIKKTCTEDVEDVVDALKKFREKFNNNPSDVVDEAIAAYKKGGSTKWPVKWGDNIHNQVFANKIHNMINELEKGKRKVVCCPKTHLCDEKTATFFGRPAKLVTGDREFANKIVICPPAFHDLSKWGGCGCLMVHELLHALGFDLQLEDESGMFPGTKEKVEKRNRERENGMVYLARYLLGKACKGYDVWED